MTQPYMTFAHGHLDEFDDFFSTGTSGTADSGNTVTTVDSERTEADDYWNGYYITFTSGANAGLSRQITDFDAASDTLTHLAFPNTVSNGDEYTINRWMLQSVMNMTSSDVTVTVENDDSVKITGVFNNAGSDEWAVFRKDVSSLNLSTSIYKAFVGRYKTSHTGSGMGAAVRLVFSDDTVHWVLGTGTMDPLFSTEFTAKVTNPITPTKTIKYIELWAIKNPASVTGTFSAEFDFALICKDLFTFPFVSDYLELDIDNNYAVVPIINRIVDETQHLGAAGTVIGIHGDTDEDAGWHGDTTVDCERLLQIMHEAAQDPWQWFTCGPFKMKVVPTNIKLRLPSTDKMPFGYDVFLRECRASSGGVESYKSRFGLI